MYDYYIEHNNTSLMVLHLHVLGILDGHAPLITAVYLCKAMIVALTGISFQYLHLVLSLSIDTNHVWEHLEWTLPAPKCSHPELLLQVEQLSLCFRVRISALRAAHKWLHSIGIINSDCCSFRLISRFELVNEMWQGIPFQVTIQDSNFTSVLVVLGWWWMQVL